MAVVMVTVMSEPLIIGTVIAEELLALSGAVEAGRLGDLHGHALDGRREHDHGEAGLEPDEDDDQRERVDVEVGRLDPGHGLLPEARPDRVQQPVLRLTRPACHAYTKRQMTEAPTSEMARGRKMNVLASDSYLTRSTSAGDEETEADRAGDAHDQPEDVVEVHLVVGWVGQGPLAVGQPVAFRRAT